MLNHWDSKPDGAELYQNVEHCRIETLNQLGVGALLKQISLSPDTEQAGWLLSGRICALQPATS